MIKPIHTLLNFGTGGAVIDVECRFSNSLPGVLIVGLVNRTVDEAKERVRSAFASCNIRMPRKRVTINLAPADIPKDSTSLDLAIAVAIMQAAGLTTTKIGPEMAFIGELGLNGNIRAVRGLIGKLVFGKQSGLTHFFVPKANLEQALIVPGITVTPVASLTELYQALNGELQFFTRETKDGHVPHMQPSPQNSELFSDIAGQSRAKRAVLIAAAGGHNILLSGPPGTGKSMLAKALPTLLPPPSRDEMLEITHLHSLCGASYEKLQETRPFRSPHHSASHIAIVGGGTSLRPGEVSLSHRGVLFLDELPEFNRATIESLRQPLEDRIMTVSRARDSAVYPANFILIATANPCPCGYYGTSKDCSCPVHRILAYRQKLSGPIMDRFDIYADVEEVEHEKLLQINKQNVVYKNACMEVTRARKVQSKRFTAQAKLNADMSNGDIKTVSHLSSKAKDILNQAAKQLNISARSYMRLIKVARTIADLDGSPTINIEHITEALQYRPQSPGAIG